MTKNCQTGHEASSETKKGENNRTTPAETLTTAERVAKLFARCDISDLPAISTNISELIALAHSARSSGYQLADAIQKDYALTTRILRIVNSAFYSLEQPVNSIPKAVVILGYDAIRDLATGIAIFEDFLKNGKAKNTITSLLTQSFLSGMQARDMAASIRKKIRPEEAFMCALLHKLGEILVSIHLPDRYRFVIKLQSEGESETAAMHKALDNLTFADIGREVGKTWKLPDKIIKAMDEEPPMPKNSYDTGAYLHNLAHFSNRLVENISNGLPIDSLVKEFKDILPLKEQQTLAVLKKNIEQAEDMSDSFRHGLMILDFQDRVENMERSVRDGVPLPEVDNNKRMQAMEDELAEAATAPVRKITIDEYIYELEKMLAEPQIDLSAFYGKLMESLHAGIGFDRAILGIVSMLPDKISLVGRYGLGDVGKGGISNFDHVLTNEAHVVTQALQTCTDKEIPPNTPYAFPGNLKYLAKDHQVYLLPICVDDKAIGLIYLDRKMEEPLLEEEELQMSKKIRDMAVAAVRKIQGENQS